MIFNENMVIFHEIKNHLIMECRVIAILYYIILYYITLYYIIFHYIILHYIILHYIIFIILYYIILYYIILYYIILIIHICKFESEDVYIDFWHSRDKLDSTDYPESLKFFSKSNN